MLLVEPDGVFYTKMDPEKVAEVVEKHLVRNQIVEEYTFYDAAQKKRVPMIDDISFFKQQVKVVLRNCGRMEYASLAAYIARDGYAAIGKAVTSMSREQVVGEMKKSGLRGRGGAGFPTGVKWEAGMKAVSDQKYMVCNADEGDPGAFMDRSVLEGDPHSIIEGMMLGGYAIGADKGYVYVRAEYPLAVERLGVAIEQARAAGLLGAPLFGTDFQFDIEIRIGAGAFVCGEETSLLASIEGRRGEPRQKPPFPFEAGLFEKPTIINNVETLASVAPIIYKGADWYAAIGTEKSKGTKVFALAGDVVNTGIIEVPMGTVLGDIIFKIGGGIPNGKGFKAIQSGGPSGGCLTKEHLNTHVDYESLQALGAIMGSGGLIVMNEDTCMVDTARYFMDFIVDESCGKCLACRVGTKRMLEILQRITEGKGEEGDIEMLEELAETLKQTAMCGLGQTASNPVLSTIRYFRDEYETHIRAHHCDAGVCSNLYTSPCRNACPAGVNVPGYMSLVAAGRYMDAYRLIRQDNPFPAVCGRVCTHPCERHCRRGTVDEPLSICSIKRFVGDFALRDELEIPKEAPVFPTGKRVAVIGSGPSGLSCAYYLARLGHAVDVYESEEVAGGVLHWGIPEYRLPNSVVDKEIRAIESAGVRIHLNARIGSREGCVMTIDELMAANDAVYVAIGTQKSKRMDIPGEDIPGVESGLAFLRRVGLDRDRSVADELVVVGGGSTAMDCARTAVRLGAKSVTVLYRRTADEMPATEEDVREALEEGVKLLTLTAPVEVLGGLSAVSGIRVTKMKQGDFGRDGRRRTSAIEGSEYVIPCTGIVTAINQELDAESLPTVDGEKGFTTDKFTASTKREGMFAGGDAAPWGAAVVVNAIADGKKAAANIDKYLGGSGELKRGEPIDIPVIAVGEVTEHGRFPTRSLSAEQRKDSFCEVACGFHPLDAMAESLRCLHCDRR